MCVLSFLTFFAEASDLPLGSIALLLRPSSPENDWFMVVLEVHPGLLGSGTDQS